MKESKSSEAYSFKRQELALKITKEIVIKFIEIGRTTPSSFPDTFKMVHSEVVKALSSKS